ncbi:hypothetical protein [Flavobacterium panacagri]|uniref:hypothetical protein n=1 Tax=Flavobacterium panacagri TaxID=3034146 RepID=UPI0025A56357|nr:hypothetical protein [Flavobacterium panacagri]
MIDNYSFNEHHKRFEPYETKCTYCGENHMKTMNDCYFVPLFVTNDRTNIVVYRSVKYSKILIGIPRCSSCKAIHEQSASKSQWITAGLVILAISLLAYNFMLLSPFVVVGGFFALIFGAIYGSKKMTESFVVGHDIYTLQDGAETNEVVRDLIVAGWSFTQPSA